MLAGALVGSLFVPGEAGRVEPTPAPRGGRSLATLSVRELRALPGIGERRALEIAAARWERGPSDPPLLLGDIPGIGPAVERGVRAALGDLQLPGSVPGRPGTGSP